MSPQHPTRGWRVAGATILAAALVSLAGCVGIPSLPSGPAPEPGRTGISQDEALVAASAPTMDFVTLTDPVDDSFTVSAPRGWSSIAYSSGAFDAHREIMSTVSPDGGTVIFLGDPTSPNYWDPAQADDLTRQFAEMLDYMELRSYTPATAYYEEWTVDRFGGLGGFRLDGVANDQESADRLLGQMAAAGYYPPAAHSAIIDFSYDSERGRIHARVFGTTLDFGNGWSAIVGGIATNRTVDEYLPMFTALSSSMQTKPEWRQRRDAAHAETMRQMEAFTQHLIAQHNANMAWIQQSAAAHQARMQAIWASNDAQMASYYERMDAMDYNQQQFLNYINEEHTVSAPGSTQTWQVATGATNYYVNPTTGQYVGGDINFDDQDLIAMGLDPDDYQQVTVVG